MNTVSRLLLPSLFAVGLSVLAQAASVSPPEITTLRVQPSGEFNFDQISVFAGHFAPGWSRTDQGSSAPEAGYPKWVDSLWETRVALLPKGTTEPILLSEELERLNGTSFLVDYEATHPSGVETQEMFLQLELPLSVAAGKSITLDGVSYDLPVEFGETVLFSAYEAGPHTLVLPGATGTVTVEGEFSVLAQDQRKWKIDSYGVRLRFSPASKRLIRQSLQAEFRYEPYASTPISIRSAANFGFSDDAPKDGQGGWTDQGPENDMRSLPSGPLLAAGVTFEIIDEASNNGNGAIVLGKSDQDFLPKAVTVQIPEDASVEDWNNLYLLHASGWTPPSGEVVGYVVLCHADGSETKREIVSGRDVGNWWAPVRLDNAAIGWEGENPSSSIGLYVSKVPLGDEPVTAIRLESAGPAMWFVVGLSASADDIVPFAPNVPWTSAANHEWVPYKHELAIESGSVFDFSRMIDAPAGKYGELIVGPDGHFEFAGRPGERARFWGVNLCFGANYLSKEVADDLAERFVRSGYNTVRLHHYDRELQLKDGASWELDPEQLDRLDYLFAAMKKRGIYINIDLYTIRDFSEEELDAIGLGDAVGAKAHGMHWRFKALMPVSEKVFDLWAKFAENLLTHRNPYTGMTWGEDPALIGICPVNEDPPSDLINSDPVVKRLYEEAFESWWAQPANHALAGDERTRAFNRFVYEMQIKQENRLREFIRGLGVKTLLTGTNCHNDQDLSYVRATFDYVDNHCYWDHPSFPQVAFKFPFQYRQTSAVSSFAQTPRGVMPTRIFGKPFAVTEFNFVFPNRYRSEGSVIMPAYAGLQDWDALYNFDYSSNANGVAWPSAGGSTFSISSDPIGLIGDRLAAMVFLRGDVAPAKNRIGFAVQADTAFASLQTPFPSTFSKLGLITGIGSAPALPETLLEEQSLAAVVVASADEHGEAGMPVYSANDELGANLMSDGILPAGSISPDGAGFVSDTGQTELRTDEGTLKVVTPRSELFVLPAQTQLNGDFASVRNGDTFCSVAVVAVDGQPLVESSRLLIAHLTDVLPTGVLFDSSDRKIQESVGRLPLLVRRGSCELTLKLAPDGDYRAWAVSSTGARLREVPLSRTDEGWVLQASTVTPEGTQLAYEIQRN